MDESEFNHLAEHTMLAIESAIEATGADIDFDNNAGILTLQFTNATQIIINKQTPLCQIWVAARSGGFHFNYDRQRQLWCLDNDSGEDLFAALSRYCSEQAGESLQLSKG